MIGNREKCFSPKGNAIANKNILQKKQKLNNPEMKMMIGSVCDGSIQRSNRNFFFFYVPPPFFRSSLRSARLSRHQIININW